MIRPFPRKHRTGFMQCFPNFLLGNTAQRASGDFARHLLANFPSEPVSYLPARILRAYFPRYFGKILENPQRIFSVFPFIIAQSGSVCQEMRQGGNLDFQESATDSATSKEIEKRPLHVMSRERFLGKHCIKPAYQLCTQSDDASYAQALCSVSLVFLLQ